MSTIQELLANDKLNVSGIIVADRVPVIKTFAPKTGGRYKSGFIFMQKGKCQYDFDQDSFEVIEGDLVYVPEGASYRCTHLISPKDCRYYVLDFNITDNDGKLLNLCTQPYRFDKCDTDALKALFDKIMKIYNVYEYSNHLILKSVVMEILYIISKSEDISGTANPRYDDIKKALSYVETHYKENISSGKLADMFNMSHSHFRRLFVKSAGYPPTIYRNRIRVHKAYEMLVNTKMSISEISEAVGFCDVYYFSTMFKKIIGVSPGKVRK